MLQIPVKNGDQTVYALVDDDQAHLLEHKWYLNKDGYAIRTVCKTIYMQQEILDVDEGLIRDHENRNKLDNRKANLRALTKTQNKQNRPSVKGSTSKYRGVYMHPVHKTWQAVCRLNGKAHYLGTFKDEDEAGKVASEFRRTHLPYSYEGDAK